MAQFSYDFSDAVDVDFKGVEDLIDFPELRLVCRESDIEKGVVDLCLDAEGHDPMALTHFHLNDNGAIDRLIVRDGDAHITVFEEISNKLGAVGDAERFLDDCTGIIRHCFRESGLKFINKSRVVFSEQTVDENGTVLNVEMGCFGHARGSVDDVTHIGTTGLGPCIGVAFVTHVDGEGAPRVSLGHFSDDLDFDNSVERFFYMNFSDLQGDDGSLRAEQSTTVTMVTGWVNEDIVGVLHDAFEKSSRKHGVPLSYGVLAEDGVVLDLATDLDTGKIIRPFGVNNNAWKSVQHLVDHETLHNSVVRCQFDFRIGVPPQR